MTKNLRLCTDFNSVVAALGGLGATATITHRSKSAVCNWRAKRSRFPATLYFIMQHELAARGYVAPPELWGFVQRDVAA